MTKLLVYCLLGEDIRDNPPPRPRFPVSHKHQDTGGNTTQFSMSSINPVAATQNNMHTRMTGGTARVSRKGDATPRSDDVSCLIASAGSPLALCAAATLFLSCNHNLPDSHGSWNSFFSRFVHDTMTAICPKQRVAPGAAKSKPPPSSRGPAAARVWPPEKTSSARGSRAAKSTPDLMWLTKAWRKINISDFIGVRFFLFVFFCFRKSEKRERTKTRGKKTRAKEKKKSHNLNGFITANMGS